MDGAYANQYGRGRKPVLSASLESDIFWEIAMKTDTFSNRSLLRLALRSLGALLGLSLWLSAGHAQTNNAAVETAKALIKSFHARDLGAWERTLAPGFVGHYPGAANLGREQARVFNQVFIDAFPDLRFDIHHVAQDGHTVMIDTTGSGTFSKPMATPDGMIPPTGKAGVVRVVFIVDTRDGQIQSERTVWNRMEFLAQIGLLK